MKLFTLCLALALIGLQFPLWLGKASVNATRKMDGELIEQRARNESLLARNTALENEVKDLKAGLQSVEEYARAELGMVKRGEVFFQVVNEPVMAPPVASPLSANAATGTKATPAPSGAAPKK